MSKLAIFVSATFVLFFETPVFASPESVMPPASPQPQTQPAPLNDDMTVAPAPALSGPPPPPPSARYYPYHQALTFRYGQAADMSNFKANDNVTGFQYLFPKFLSPRIEAGADLHNGGIGHVHAGMRWTFHERSYFRPSVKAGLDLLADSSQGLATIGYINNYYLRLTGTLEYVVSLPYSVRLEPEVLIGSQHDIAELTLGISRGW